MPAGVDFMAQGARGSYAPMIGRATDFTADAACVRSWRFGLWGSSFSEALTGRQLRAGDHDGWIEDTDASCGPWADDERSRLSFRGSTSAVGADQRLVWFAGARWPATQNAHAE